jgi:hypothetical protein
VLYIDSYKDFITSEILIGYNKSLLKLIIVKGLNGDGIMIVSALYTSVKMNDINDTIGYCISLKSTNGTKLEGNKCYEAMIGLFVPNDNFDFKNQEGDMVVVNDDNGWGF